MMQWLGARRADDTSRAANMHFQNARLREGGRYQRCVRLLWARGSGSVGASVREGVADIPQLQGAQGNLQKSARIGDRLSLGT